MAVKIAISPTVAWPYARASAWAADQQIVDVVIDGVAVTLEALPVEVNACYEPKEARELRDAPGPSCH
jgi:hypothetical protein